VSFRRKHKHRHLTVAEEWGVCPDCIERGAVNAATGQPVFMHGVRLTVGCETCMGTGAVVRSVKRKSFLALPARG